MFRFKQLLLIVLAFILLFTLSACTENGGGKTMLSRESSLTEAGEINYGQITAESVEVKAGADESYRTVETISKGENVDILDDVNGWYVIKLPDNRIGCVNSRAIQPIVKEENQPSPAEGTDAQNGQTSSPRRDEMFSLINEARKSYDLPPLKMDTTVARVAQTKAKDIADNDYFSHYSPTFGSPFEMLEDHDIGYLYAGENLATNATAEAAHRALMDSSGHRKNILNPDFTHIGIGVNQAGEGRFIFVQLFIGR